MRFIPARIGNCVSYLHPLTTYVLRATQKNIYLNFIWFSIAVSVARSASDQTTFKVASPTRSVRLAGGAPFGISFEFFEFPDYMTKVPSTKICMANLAEEIGSPLPSRVGGTTGDFGLYDSKLSSAISYKLSPSDKGVPKQLVFGPEYIRLASTLPGSVILGLNRKHNDLKNTLEAAKEALKQMKNLHAFEFGNEPEYWSSREPIAGGKPWNFSANAASERTWQEAIGTALRREDIVQAGNYLGKFQISDLAKQEKNATRFVKSFGIHSYPQNVCGGSKTDLKTLMDHKSIVQYMDRFKADIEAAASLDKPAYFSETNSVACGGGSVSPTFGAALWTVDYIMQSLLAGIKALYFHHGTLGRSDYSFWGRYVVGSPYYGAYFSAMALKDVDGISMLDDGLGSYAAYLFTSKSIPVRIMLYNSLYAPEAHLEKKTSGKTLTLDTTGLQLGHRQSLQVFRLKASSSEARVDRGHSPDISGLKFEDITCQKIKANSPPEFVQVFKNGINVLVRDSEAVLIQF